MGMNMMARLQAKHQIELRAARLASRQEAADFFLAAVNKEFGFGPKRQARLIARFNALMEEAYNISDGDTVDQEYARAKHEEMMRQVCGKAYVPREERYGYD